MDADVKALADELSTALADLVHSLDEGQANVGEIGATLSEMLELARAAKDRPPAEPPQVHVTVQPAPVTVSAAPACDFEITHSYDGDGRIKSSYVKRISAKE